MEALGKQDVSYQRRPSYVGPGGVVVIVSARDSSVSRRHSENGTKQTHGLGTSGGKVGRAVRSDTIALAARRLLLLGDRAKGVLVE